MMSSRWAVAFLLLSFVVFVPSSEVHASFIPISSSISINGDSNLDLNTPNPGATVTDSQGATINDLHVTYYRLLQNDIEALTETSFSDATWVDTSTGTASLYLALSASDLFGARLGFSSIDSEFEYSFVAQSNGVVTFGGEYEHVSGSYFGGGTISISDFSTGTLDQGYIYDSTTRPSSLFLSVNLVAGESYKLNFSPFMGISCPYDSSTGEMIECDLSHSGSATRANLSFSFQAVPLPSAVWLFGSGLLGLLGIARRKK